ncbi:MAG: OmpA family protein [Acidobacteria bacterium]|nr:OmpA family protein [Acidobacteriota bacterium]
MYSSPSQQPEIEQNLKDVLFAFDRYDLTADDQQLLKAGADWLKANPKVYVIIAGDADDRGSIVYNLALSQRRASVTRDALIEMGVPAEQIVFATGWGKLYPICAQAEEACWSRNRRAHFSRW